VLSITPLARQVPPLSVMVPVLFIPIAPASSVPEEGIEISPLLLTWPLNSEPLTSSRPRLRIEALRLPLSKLIVPRLMIWPEPTEPPRTRINPSLTYPVAVRAPSIASMTPLGCTVTVLETFRAPPAERRSVTLALFSGEATSSDLIDVLEDGPTTTASKAGSMKTGCGAAG
jgi:hypothetical protein